MNITINKKEQKLLGISCIGGFLLGVICNILLGIVNSVESGLSWNGGVFYGDMIDGVPNGDGRFEKDEMVYRGYWQNGKMSFGKIESPKYIYEGELDRMKFNGYGVCKYKDGNTYWGYWKDDYKEGLGLLKRADGVFTFCIYKNGTAQVLTEQNYNVGDRVYGIDVSRHQGVIKWQDLFFSCNNQGGVSGMLDKTSKYLQPILFSIAKSTQGSKLRDSRFESNYSEAKRCGKICGAYHFLTMNVSGKEQAQFFIENTPLEKGDFPPVLDLEKNNVGGKVVSDEEFASIVPIAKEWIAIIKKHYGVSPIIYTNMNVYRKFISVDSELSKYDLWIANPGTESPSIKNSIMWQFSHHGKANGIPDNDVDINLFKGNYKELEKYIESKGIK